MVNIRSNKSIDIWGLVVSLVFLLMLFIWIFAQTFNKVYFNEDLVFPMETKNARLIEFHANDVLSQDFIAIYDNMNEVRLMMFQGNESDFEIGIVGANNPLLAKLSKSDYANSPAVTIKLEEEVKKGDELTIFIKSDSKSTSSYKMWLQDINTNHATNIVSSTHVNSVNTGKTMLFLPVFDGVEKVVVGDIFEYNKVGKNILKSLFEGKPIFVQWILLTSLLLSMILSTWFIYVVFKVSTKNFKKREKKNIALAMFATLLMLIILL